MAFLLFPVLQKRIEIVASIGDCRSQAEPTEHNENIAFRLGTLWEHGGGPANVHRFLQTQRSRAVRLVPRRARPYRRAPHQPDRGITASQLEALKR